MDNRFTLLSERVIPILRPYARRISVFGSYARGEETPQSDLDLLVELRPIQERPPLGLKWFGLEQELSRLLGREVELVTEEALSPYVREFVEDDRIVLYEE
jgi:hypothetical protein